MKSTPKIFNIRYKASFESLTANNHIKIWMAKPLNSECQKINNFSISHTPKKTYKDGQGNEILYFEFINTKKIEIKMEIQAELWKQKIITQNNAAVISKIYPKSIKRFLKNENFLEQKLEIKNLAFKIAGKEKLDLDKIKTIFDFITKNFKYCYPIEKRGVKYLDLNGLKGDCGEYSSLFVTMCRILKIPAKNQTGFVIFPKKKKIAEHGWASVYLKPNGWLDMDTQYASLEKNETATKKYFARRNDYRIIFTTGFNVPLKPRIPKKFNLSYWNKLGLPLTHNSVQTLQPIVFVSKNKIEFKDNIKII